MGRISFKFNSWDIKQFHSRDEDKWAREGSEGSRNQMNEDARCSHPVFYETT